jgi:hypothetical protein
MNQKESSRVNLCEGLSIFDNHYWYLETDDLEKNSEQTGKVKDIQGIQAHAGRDFFVPDGENAERGCRDI